MEAGWGWHIHKEKCLVKKFSSFLDEGQAVYF